MFTLFIPLILSLASPAPCMVSGPDIAAALASAPHCLSVPAGDYYVRSTGAAWLSVSADDFDLHGAGIGKTRVHVQATTLERELYVIELRGARQHVHDLSIIIEPGFTGPWATGGIAIRPEGVYAHVDHIEITGGYGSGLSDGFGIGTYRPWLNDSGNQYVTIEDCWIHDSIVTGIGINSNRNIVRNNVIERVGNNEWRHGIYAQGGYNLYQNNVVAHASGYSFHGWKHVPNIDASGDIWESNTSIEPGIGHMVVSGIPNEINPAFPVGTPLTRDVTIVRNTFIGDPPRPMWIDAAMTISGNVFVHTR